MIYILFITLTPIHTWKIIQYLFHNNEIFPIRICKYYKTSNSLSLTFNFPILLSIAPVLFSKELIFVLRSFMSQERIQWRHKHYGEKQGCFLTQFQWLHQASYRPRLKQASWSFMILQTCYFSYLTNCNYCIINLVAKARHLDTSEVSQPIQSLPKLCLPLLFQLSPYFLSWTITGVLSHIAAESSS